ncbi:CBS domain-containing protein, partial [Micrococcus luteus]|uniref:CBS domain-containing protein n=1 Tax=Micrococcus luteus TaxID=1270 RepID=UPI00343954D6
MKIADVLKNKGAGVLTVGPEMSVADLLASLVTRNVGAMVVVAEGEPVGIVSERDVVRRLHEFGSELLGRPVSDIMT